MMSITKTSEIYSEYQEIIANDLRSKNRSRSQQGDTNYGLCIQNNKCVFLIGGWILG